MIRYLDIVDPKRRFRARGKSELTPKDIKAILVSDRAVLLKCRRPFPPRMQFLPFTVGWEKKIEERVNNTRRLVIPKQFFSHADPDRPFGREIESRTNEIYAASLFSSFSSYYTREGEG